MNAKLITGVYDTVVSQMLMDKLQQYRDQYDIGLYEVEPENAVSAYEQYLMMVIRRTLSQLTTNNEKFETFCERVIQLANEFECSDIPGDYPTNKVLIRIANRLNDIIVHNPSSELPGIPLSKSGLIVNAKTDFRIGSELKKEIGTADKIDLICSFIKWSGIVQIKEEMAHFCKKGGIIRVLTTAYMGATDVKAIDALVNIGAKVKVSLDTRRTRLHAKAWLFHRNTGFSTAYIGSSNLSTAALTDGIEWNVRVSQIENPQVVEKFSATFETYWNDSEFVSYDNEETKIRFLKAITIDSDQEGADITLFDVRPYPFQQEILDQIDNERQLQGINHNLVVSATGTGKTMIAAFDYSRVVSKAGNNTLLFVAHRAEILKQSMMKFRQVLMSKDFGELFVGGNRPIEGNHVFASIQSLNQYGVDNIHPEKYDYVVIDEFHHAEATTYVRLLDRIKPKYLLGLTATPERMDNKDIKRRFGGRVSAELRLWDAIEKNLLVPFSYFGVYDNTELDKITWKRGEYDTSELENVYTASYERVNIIIRELSEKLNDIHKARGLGFCVGVKHAEFMANSFNKAGIKSEFLVGETSRQVRESALSRLEKREINFVFTVDLFNEGVDIPFLDTILLLRPTQSPSIFLQQIGRGLRRHPQKTHLMIFDFISQCSSNYRFDIKYRYLLSLSRKALVGEIEKGFPLLPSGCSISLDRLSSQVILKNVRQAIDNSFLNIVNELKTFPDDVNLSDFIYETQLTVEDIYRNNHYWSEYLYRAGKNITIASEEEKKVLKSFSRFTHIDDVEQINAYKSLVKPGALSSDEDTNAKRKYTLMLATTLYGDEAAASPKETLKSKFMSSELLINEFLELLTVLEKNAYMSSAEWGHFKNVPLRIHCQYSLSEIFSAFGIIKNSHLYRAREGEYYHSPLHVNLIFMTCKKVEGDYSPSTMYKDYAISTEKIHWQSQNATKQQSKKGMRLIDHHKHGVAHLLFARSTRKDDRSETNPYVFLGEAECYEYNGERPINIVWRLRMPMSMHHFRMFSILD